MELYWDGYERRYLDKNIMEEIIKLFGMRVMYYFTEDDLEELKTITGAEPLVKGIETHGKISYTKV